MEKIFKNFKNETTFIRNNTVIVTGSLDDEKSLIKISLPELDSNICNSMKNMQHCLEMKNDVYETATIKTELECKVEIKKNTNDILIPCFEYCCESYEEYLSSEINQVENQMNSTVIYEDQNVIIYSNKIDVSPCKILWMCMFKDTEIHSIRELTDEKYLVDLKKTIQSLLKDHGIPQHEVCSYFDYNGKISTLYLNIASISTGLHLIKSTGSFIYFDVFLKNILMDSDYYRGDMFYIKKVHKTDTLC